MNSGYNKNVNILAKVPCKNLLNIYRKIFISVLAKKSQHWAKIDKPLNPIKKLANVALRTSGVEITLAILLQPIVISNKPLINA